MERLVPVLDKNIDILQSSLITNANYNVTRTEMQIFIILIAAAQHDLKRYFAENIEKGRSVDDMPVYSQDVQVALRLNKLPIDMGGHELTLKTAAENLIKKTIEIKTETGWILQPFLNKVEYVKKERLLIMNVPPDSWNMIMNVKLGYSEYQLFTALNLKSVYSVRFYMMASNKLGAQEITFDQLKTQFNLQDKYADNTNFLKRIIYPASQELKEKAPVTFTAKPYKKTGSKEYVGIVFTPQNNPAFRDPALEHKKLTHGRIQIGMSLTPEEITWLTREDKLAFTKVELSRNFETFNVAKKIFGDGLLDAMNHVYEFMIRRGKGGQKGYFIKSLKQNSKTSDEEATLF